MLDEDNNDQLPDMNTVTESLQTDLTRIENLTITDSPSKRRISKEDFGKTKSLLGSNSDPSDPLDQLDPLWTLGKK